MRKLVDLPREYLVLLMEAGYVMITMRRLDDAREVFEGVSALAPASEIPRIALGNVFSAEKKYDDAIREYKKALKMAPKAALAQAHIGEVLLLQRKKKEGVAALNAAVALDPESKAGDFARELLAAVEKGVLPFPDAPPANFKA